MTADPGWLPIASAPRDGTIVLLTSHRDPEVVTSGWYERGAFDRRWYSCQDHADIQPTHWRPLPPPPSQEG